jgi:hypothetical protein
LLIRRIGLLAFGSKGALYPCINFHKSLQSSNPEKWSINIQNLHELTHGLDYTKRIKCGFATNTGKPRLFCLLFQLKGKVSALFRGMSGRFLIRSIERVFTRTLVNQNPQYQQFVANSGSHRSNIPMQNFHNKLHNCT